jgi:thiamine-monophosphate kinase
VTVVGHAPHPEALVRRAGARADNVVVVTGALGGAAAGLLVLERPELGEALAAPIAALLGARQLEPQPRLAAGRALADCGATAMIDLSDGLGGDAGHLAAASSVALRIEAERLPIQAGVAEVAAAAGKDPIDLAAGAGEDYELLATLPADRIAAASAAVAACGLELTAVGSVEAGEGVLLSETGGAARPPAGFDQFRPPEPDDRA